MDTVVIEHVALNELPAAWRARLPASQSARVTVRIEAEAPEKEIPEREVSPTLAANPIFGLWQDREEAADATVFARQLRAPRYNDDGSRREG